MASISSSTTVFLDNEEKNVLEKAINIIKEISSDLCDADLYLSEDGVFYCIKESYSSHDNKLPSFVDMYE